MITKVVLGVALVLIEFSIISRSQTISLSSVDDAPTTIFFPTTSTAIVKEFDEISTTSAAVSSEIPQVVTNEMTSSIKVATALEFTTSTVDTTTIQVSSTTVEDFKLPENCSAYKVSYCEIPVTDESLFHFILSFS